MSNYNIQTLITSNKQAMLESSECGCIFCLKRYDPKLIDEYCQDIDKTTGLWENCTAICYYCSVDSVVPNSLFDYTDGILLEMRNIRFKGYHFDD